ncbi:MAG: septal ring lytic transglycosylase RlpA family protein [Beijerinckiaceae bacterium]
MLKKTAALAFLLTLSPLAAHADQLGMASYYGAKFEGRKTASGERYAARQMTAAHRTMPFGTKLKVTHLRNGKSVIVRVNDRGPFVRGRIVDVSGVAAQHLGLKQSGVARVRVSRL